MGASPSTRRSLRAWTAASWGSLVGLTVALTVLSCDRPHVAADQEALPTEGSLQPDRSALPAPPMPSAAEAPDGFELADVVGVTATDRGHAIVLQAGQRALPIFVGESEGLSIQLRLSGERFHRPLTHDLMDAVLEELGGTIESVRVDRHEDEIFYSVVVLEHHTERRELDSRTSDAIALALGHDVPIFVRTSVLDTNSVDLRGLLPSPGPRDRRPQSRPAQEAPGTPTLEPGTVAL